MIRMHELTEKRRKSREEKVENSFRISSHVEAELCLHVLSQYSSILELLTMMMIQCILYKKDKIISN